MCAELGKEARAFVHASQTLYSEGSNTSSPVEYSESRVCVAQASLELLVNLLLQPKALGFTGISHHEWLPGFLSSPPPSSSLEMRFPFISRWLLTS